MEKAKLSCWKAYNKNKTEQNLRALKAEIYELYCHEQIFINSEENTIVFPTCKEMEKKEQLRLSKIGKILFYSDEVSLAEFDVLGMNSSSVKMLLLTTKEYVEKVHMQSRLDIDDLVEEIRNELRQIPRYSVKIDISLLQPLIECTTDEDTSTYQIRMLEFLEELKKEYTIA
jgi:hypothetical protein